MKKIILMVAALVLSTAAQAEGVNELAGTYSECVKWTIFNGVPTSKKFEMVYGVDRSLLYRIEFFNGTATCEGEPINRQEMSDFEVIKDLSSRKFHLVDLRERTENLYFELMVSEDSMSVVTSKKYPVEIQLNNFITLKRQ
ncbi:MAG: hypothetical protein KF681_04795 [Bdellovibrionaceae bacterium]|nr:hypothetical protein [Pseudobdellovibrionaceae bacterium]